MNILTLPNDILAQQSTAVAEIDAPIVRLAEDMIETMHSGRGIGLAGVQVGILKRLFVVHVTGDMPRVFINPHITETSVETMKYEEGCLSIPGIYADVVRPATITVQAWNEHGKPFSLDADGVLGRVIQHEYDHLNGILFLKYLSEMKRSRLLKQYEQNKKR